MRPTPAIAESKARPRGRRIVLTTFGALGDLYPYLALAQELQARGHKPVIATSRYHQQRIEARGLGFHAVRPDGPDPHADHDALRRIMNARTGTEYVVRVLLMAALRDSYEDLLAAAQDADLLVSHVLTYAARLVAEKTGIAWATGFLQPLGFFSAYDPPVLPQVSFLAKLRGLGPAFHRPLFWLAKRSCRSWGEPWHRLRAKIGLPPTVDNPLFEGLYSPSLILAMFSPLLAKKQPDWPTQTVVSGFPFLDESSRFGGIAELSSFLDAGPPPLVFTLGSSAVVDPGAFYEHSSAAAKLLGHRAVLIVGNDRANWPASLPDGVVACKYAPFRELFPRASAIVHPGGIGTTGLAMRSGRPTLVVPFAHDQFDNAARVRRLSIARTIRRDDYAPERVAAELRQLLNNPIYSKRASAIGQNMQHEDGVQTACDALEQLLGADRPAEAVPNGQVSR